MIYYKQSNMNKNYPFLQNFFFDSDVFYYKTSNMTNTLSLIMKKTLFLQILQFYKAFDPAT